MARKSTQTAPEPSPAEKRVRRPTRHKNLTAPLSGEATSAEMINLMTDTLAAHTDMLGWGGLDEKIARLNADDWARTLVRSIRYGVGHEGEGFSVLDQSVGTPPLCEDCES